MTDEKMLDITNRILEDMIDSFDDQIKIEEVDIYEMDNFFRIQGRLTYDKDLDVNTLNRILNRVSKVFKTEGLGFNFSIKNRYISIIVDEYIYQVEVGLESIADDIEDAIGSDIQKLRVSEVNGKPYIRFSYFEDLDEARRQEIRKAIDEIVASYVEVDSDEIEFDSYQEIMRRIKDGKKD